MVAVKQETERGLSPAQYELVNMMSCVRSEADVAELKSLLVKFIDSRIQLGLDRLYEDGSLSNEKLEALSHEHLRTAYRASL